jgi:hypothetical protein
MTTTRLLHLTLCNSRKTSKVQHLSETWDAIVQRLTQPPVITPFRDSLKWPLFTPFKMKEHGALMRETAYGEAYSRCIANVEFADLLCLDIDNDPSKELPYTTVDDAKRLLHGLAYALYTTYNHRSTTKNNVDKFRVVLPLAYPVTYGELVERKTAIKKLFPFIDPASLSISQPFYVLVCHPDRIDQHQAFASSGEWLDVRALEPENPTAATTASPRLVQTGEVHSDLPEIKVKGGITYRADELYHSLQDGYAHRVQCYRIDGPDQKPGCFIFRIGSGLRYFDQAVGKAEFIRILKVQRADTQRPLEDDEPAISNVRLWPVKSKPETEAARARTRARTATQRIQYEPLRLSQRFLPDDLHLKIPPYGITVIRSPKGTGKTELLKKLTAQVSENGESVMLLGHRIFLLKNLAGRTNLDHYLDLEDGATTPSMAICMNSLTRIDPNVDEPYDTIVVDESEQVFQALISKTLRDDLSRVFNNLLWLFTNAKRIICLDADLTSDLTIQIIEYLRGYKSHDDIMGVDNTYRIGDGKTTLLYENKMHLLADALDSVDRGEKVFITCNSRKFATTVDAIIKSMGKTSLLVTAHTNELPDVEAFIKDPTNECKQYDAVVASPTLSTGVSIGVENAPETTHFTKVYGFFSIRPGTFQDVDQALSRVRNCDDVSVWIQGNDKQPRIQSDEEIFHKIVDIEKGSLKRLWDEEHHLTKGQRIWASIYAQINHMIQRWSVNKDVQFTRLRRDLGFIVDTIPADMDKSRAAAALHRNVKDGGPNRAQAIYDAIDIDPDDEKKLASKRQRTRDEQLTLDKIRLQSYLGDDWSVETIERALQQELFRSLSRIKNLYALPDAVIRTDDIDDRIKNENTFTANRHRVMQRELITHLCTAAQIDLDSMYERIKASEDIEVTRGTMLAVATAFNDRRKDFNYYFDTRIHDPTGEKNIKKVWEATFGSFLSLNLARRKLGPRDNREYHYYIDVEEADLIHRVLKEKAFY